jgi:hypothetical protein
MEQVIAVMKKTQTLILIEDLDHACPESDAQVAN